VKTIKSIASRAVKNKRSERAVTSKRNDTPPTVFTAPIDEEPKRNYPHQNRPQFNRVSRKTNILKNGLPKARKQFSQLYQEAPNPEPTLEELLRDNRQRRWKLQGAAADLLPGEGVSRCLRRYIPTAQDIQIYEHTRENNIKTHFYGNLQTCSSVWTCAICAAKITERRRKELEKAIGEAKKQGLFVYMATFTFSHTLKMELKDILTRFKRARRAVKSGRFALNFKKKYHIIGCIEVLEVTYGENSNGWHPHTHELIFTDKELNLPEYEAEIRTQWEHEALREGLTMNYHGFKIEATWGAIQDYISKFGHLPQKQPWGTENEMTKGHLKKGRGSDQHLTPFGILEEITEGNENLKKTFIEYAKAFKGRHQLQWTPGLKKRLGVEDKTDEEIAAEREENAVPIISMDKSAWRYVLGNDMRGELLELESAEAIKSTLISIGVPPDEVRIIQTDRVNEHSGGDYEYTPESPGEQPDNMPNIFKKPKETASELAVRLSEYGVTIKAQPCAKCQSRLYRPVLGTYECCNCNPSPLWSYQTIENIKKASNQNIF
jgi:hypothetical protein